MNEKKGTSFIQSVLSVGSINVVIMFFAFARQAFVAANFGTTTEMDLYFFSYAIGMIFIFTPGAIFEHVAIPHLVRARERLKNSNYYCFSNMIFIYSILFSIILTTIFVFAMPFIVDIMAMGFNEDEKSKLLELLNCFIPWFLIFPIYNAMNSIYKSEGNYSIVTFIELALTILSILFIYLLSDEVSNIPYAYFLSLIILLLVLIIHRVSYYKISISFNELYLLRRMIKNSFQLLLNQPIKSATSILERNIQTYLPPGSISTFGYANQLVVALSGLLSFKQIFMIPLSSDRGRVLKTERLIVGILFLTLPLAFFLNLFSSDVISILYGRGQFDVESIKRTSSAFSILIFTVIFGTLNAPLIRLFQVIDKINVMLFLHILNLFGMLLFCVLFVWYLELGVEGLAYSILANSFISTVLLLILLNVNGIKLSISNIFKRSCIYASMFISLYFLFKMMPSHSNVYINIAVNSSVWAACTVCIALICRSHVLFIVRGVSNE